LSTQRYWYNTNCYSSVETPLFWVFSRVIFRNFKILAFWFCKKEPWKMSERAGIALIKDETRGVQGRVKEMVGKFGSGKKASTPLDAEKLRLEAQKAKAVAARYNMVLRGQQMMQLKMQQQRKEGKTVDFLPHEFTEEWEEYPWHLAAAFTDSDEDAFWMPELAIALEQEDEAEINRAVLRFFLEENDPERLKEIDSLLQQFAGSEEVLFVSLHKEYSPALSDERKQPIPDDAASAGTSTVASLGEEEKSPEPSAVNRRRPSYVVSGVKKDAGWALNPADDDMKIRMASSGEDAERVQSIVAVAAANQLEPFAPGGTD
jgi:hypothetical protein